MEGALFHMDVTLQMLTHVCVVCGLSMCSGLRCFALFVASRGLGGGGESLYHCGSWGLEALNAAQESQVQKGGSLA